MDYHSIPREAAEQLKCCTTAEEILELADSYGIPMTMEKAEALLTQDFAALSELNGCGKKMQNCNECAYGRFVKWEDRMGVRHPGGVVYWCDLGGEEVYPLHKGYIDCPYQ